MHALELPVMTFALRVLFSWPPRTLPLRYWRRDFASEMGNYVFTRHARIVFEQMKRLADDCRILLDQSQVAPLCSSSMPLLIALVSEIAGWIRLTTSKTADRQATEARVRLFALGQRS